MYRKANQNVRLEFVGINMQSIHLRVALWADNRHSIRQFGLVLPSRGVILYIVSLVVGRESHRKLVTVNSDVAVICEMEGQRTACPIAAFEACAHGW